MANGRLPLSRDGEEKLMKLMSELDWNDKRPEALKLAFVKGLVSNEGVPEPKERVKSDFMIGDGVIARGEEYILYKHILIDKIGQPLDAKKIDELILRYLEEGLEIISTEIDSLSDLDNYLLYLVENHSLIK
ncbi:hypothetical protein ACE6ED_22850 [Paenibacillus sp. CN-4]|uniref:hypothetical protein n=1 Tax=Paenibacillus nanchangensis TaxID=3348343 RepID=UPI00397AEF8D